MELSSIYNGSSVYFTFQFLVHLSQNWNSKDLEEKIQCDCKMYIIYLIYLIS